MTLPALFLSHGSPMTAIEPSDAHDFLSRFGAGFARPRAILAVSAHWETDAPMVSAARKPETIHDFYGFPPELYAIQYPAPGAPDLAARTKALLDGAGIPCGVDPDRGLDHGAWTPLYLAYPDADIPVTQLSVQPRAGTAHHLAVGRALRPLRDEGVLIMVTGSVTHNLGDFGRFPPDGPPADYVRDFTEWLAAALDGRRDDDLLAYRERAPGARRAHPTEEHFLPLFAALGAGGGGAGRRLHDSTTFAVLRMDAYAFG